jgi:hypothetical protein
MDGTIHDLDSSSNILNTGLFGEIGANRNFVELTGVVVCAINSPKPVITSKTIMGVLWNFIVPSC